MDTGKYPDVGSGNVDIENKGGTLVVFTPTYADTTSGRTLTNGPYERAPMVHSGYRVFDSQGTQIRYVRNHSLVPSTDEPPAEITLAPGRYLVQPDVADPGPSKFWVTIEPQHETQIDVAKVRAPETMDVR